MFSREDVFSVCWNVGNYVEAVMSHMDYERIYMFDSFLCTYIYIYIYICVTDTTVLNPINIPKTEGGHTYPIFATDIL